jgi:hypothetical protein
MGDPLGLDRIGTEHADVYCRVMRAVRLYLRLGDRVHHGDRVEWGTGAVVEEMTSTVEGGTCLVRILFDDGTQRTFNNDLDSETCCYFMGLRKETRFDWDLRSVRARRVASRKSLPRG